MGMPTNCHIEINEMVMRAGPFNPNHGWTKSSRPTVPSIVWGIPHKGDSIRLKRYPTITIDIIAGKKIRVRYVFLNFNSLDDKKAAINKPTGVCIDTC